MFAKFKSLMHRQSPISHTTKILTFVILRHRVTIWVLVLTSLDNLTNDFLILKTLTINKSLAKLMMRLDRKMLMLYIFNVSYLMYCVLKDLQALKPEGVLSGKTSYLAP